jgi:glycosyltransferase involved in cell wall biosynthesis
MIENTADDAQVFGVQGGEPRLSYDLKEKIVILYTGTLESYQGIDVLLRAFAQLSDRYPQAHVLLAGGQPSQVNDYREMARGLGLSKSVTFAGGVPPACIQRFLEAADILISPRCRGTNTPLKIYGYLRSGKPIIATDLATHTQVLDRSVAELVAPTVAGLQTGIRRLLDDPSHRARLAAAAAARAADEYSDARYLERVAEFYRRVIDANARGAMTARAGYAGADPGSVQPPTRSEQ